MEQQKKCSKCGSIKPITEYSLRSDTGKYRNECKECQYAARRAYYRDNKKKLSDYNRNWRANNQDSIKERSRSYYAKKRNSILAKQKDYYRDNKDKVLDYQQEYRKTHAEQISIQHKEYWASHLDERHAYQAKYNEENSEALREKRKQKYHADVESAKKKNRENYLKHHEKRTQNQREYYAANKEVLIKKHVAHQIQRLKTDPLFKMKEQTRNLIRNSFRRTGYRKNTKTEKILGCDFETFRTHLLATWVKNYGTEWNGEEYHIDHIKPLATAKTEKDVLALCHYENLQMLKPDDNLYKNASLDWTLEK